MKSRHGETAATASGARRPGRDPLDLRGVRCPVSWAKAKVHLEGLERGEELTILLDDPKGVRDVPLAAEAEGYAVAEPQAQGSYWVLTITV